MKDWEKAFMALYPMIMFSFAGLYTIFFPTSNMGIVMMLFCLCTIINMKK